MKLCEKDFIIELRGNGKCLIEGMEGLEEYGDASVSASLGKMTVCIRGKDLRMFTLAEDRLGICGEIYSVSFGEKNDK